MPHIDEMLGAATLASVGLFAAIALQPTQSGNVAPVATVATATRATPIVCVTTVEVVASRGVESAYNERRAKLERECSANDAPQPRV